MIEINNELIIGAIGCATTVLTYFYTKGKNDSKNEQKINRHEQNIQSLDNSVKRVFSKLDTLHDEKIKVTEALERTYVTRDFVYREFVNNTQFKSEIVALEAKIVSLEEKLLQRMDGMRESIDLILDLKRGVKVR